MPDDFDSSSIKPKWQERFAFFDAHGAPKDPSFKAAMKALPWRKRLLLSVNFYAIAFGPLYFFATGMWRKGLTLLAWSFAVAMVATAIEWTFQRSLGDVSGLLIALLSGISANYSYYLETVKGNRSWNFFEGQRVF